MDAFIDVLLERGIAIAIVVGFILGIISPKWVIDEYRKRHDFDQMIIRRLSGALKNLADREEARRAKAAEEAENDNGKS